MTVSNGGVKSTAPNLPSQPTRLGSFHRQRYPDFSPEPQTDVMFTAHLTGDFKALPDRIRLSSTDGRLEGDSARRREKSNILPPVTGSFPGK